MAQSISNLKGLVSTNPFLGGTAPKTGGTTTSAFAPTNTQSGTIPGSSSFNQPIPTSVNFSGLQPLSSFAPTSSSAPASGGQGSSAPINYQMTPQEASGGTAGIAAYNARIAAGQNSGSPPQPPANNGVSTQNGITTTPTNNSQTGGTIVAPTPGTPSSTTTPPPNINDPNNPNTATGSTFKNAVGTLAQTASTSTPEYQAALAQYNTANANLQKLRDKYATETSDIATTPGDLSLANGEQGALYNRFSGQQSALTGEMSAAQSAAQTATGQQNVQQTGLNSAAGLVSPTQVPYSNQYLSPVTGQPVGGGGGGSTGSALASLPAQAQTAVQSYASQIQNGQMTRADAESRLSAYGIVGTNALNEALGTGFNTNASNASAGTTAVGQQIQTAAASTNKALDTLGSAFSSLSPAQTQGIPATNSIANWIAGAFGSDALQKYKTNLADARSQLIGVLNSSGGTPTGNEATANQYLPDNMTKAQFDTNVGTAQNPGIVRQLIQQKVSSFTGSGTQNGSTNTNSSYGGGANPWS